MPSAAIEARFSGLIQTDWVVHRQSSRDELDPASGAPLNRDRFLLRRARVAVSLERGYAFGRIGVELGGAGALEARPYDAWLGASLDAGAMRVRALAGLVPIPFGFDAMEPPDARPVLERTNMVRALFPGQRDLGLVLEASYLFVRGTLAVMNGAPLGETGWSGLDFDASKDIVARLGVELEPSSEIRLYAGASGLGGRGLHHGTAATKDRLAWTDGNEDGFVALSELGVVPGTPATPSRGFSRFALGADARAGILLPVLGELSLQGEILRAKNLDRGFEPADLVASGRALRELGWAVGAALELTRHALIAVRYDVYHADDDARRTRGGEIVPEDPRYSTLALAASARLPPLRLMLEYDLVRNPLGRSASGSPTTLKDDALTVRGELAF